MTLTVELAEEQIAAPKAKAATEGLSLEDWLAKIADQQADPSPKPLKSAYGSLPSMARVLPLKKSTKIAVTCSRASAKNFEDSWSR
jgi:hypothetical protein